MANEKCPVCGYDLESSSKAFHQGKRYNCPNCGKFFLLDNAIWYAAKKIYQIKAADAKTIKQFINSVVIDADGPEFVLKPDYPPLLSHFPLSLPDFLL